eukprot:537047-Rhodomonas_salina.1
MLVVAAVAVAVAVAIIGQGGWSVLARLGISVLSLWVEVRQAPEGLDGIERRLCKHQTVTSKASIRVAVADTSPTGVKTRQQLGRAKRSSLRGMHSRLSL